MMVDPWPAFADVSLGSRHAMRLETFVPFEMPFDLSARTAALAAARILSCVDQ